MPNNPPGRAVAIFNFISSVQWDKGLPSELPELVSEWWLLKLHLCPLWHKECVQREYKEEADRHLCMHSSSSPVWILHSNYTEFLPFVFYTLEGLHVPSPCTMEKHMNNKNKTYPGGYRACLQKGMIHFITWMLSQSMFWALLSPCFKWVLGLISPALPSSEACAWNRYAIVCTDLILDPTCHLLPAKPTCSPDSI